VPCEPLNTSPAGVAGSKKRNGYCRTDFLLTAAVRSFHSFTLDSVCGMERHSSAAGALSQRKQDYASASGGEQDTD